MIQIIKPLKSTDKSILALDYIHTTHGIRKSFTKRSCTCIKFFGNSCYFWTNSCVHFASIKVMSNIFQKILSWHFWVFEYWWYNELTCLWIVLYVWLLNIIELMTLNTLFPKCKKQNLICCWEWSGLNEWLIWHEDKLLEYALRIIYSMNTSFKMDEIHGNVEMVKLYYLMQCVVLFTEKNMKMCVS